MKNKNSQVPIKDFLLIFILFFVVIVLYAILYLYHGNVEVIRIEFPIFSILLFISVYKLINSIERVHSNEL